MLGGFVGLIGLVVVVRLNGYSTGSTWGRPWFYRVTDGEGVLAALIFLLWFRRARINAESSGWYQRRGRDWTIAGWIVPVVSLWFPFQIMADIWRASLPPEQRQQTADLPGLWWTTWLLATIVNFGHVPNEQSIQRLAFVSPLAVQNIWTGGLVLLVVSGIALIMIVRQVSSGPLGAGPPAVSPVTLGPSALGNALDPPDQGGS
ncbi:MAG TPA: DUF4328 domain-containing protein [Streptosporangiaceae bacterium]